jgi:hypothetical protein
LDEILGERRDGEDVFQKEATEEEDRGTQKKIAETLQSLLEVTKRNESLLETNNNLLTLMNTGIRKNTMMLEELMSSNRNQEREERRRWANERRRWAEERQRWRQERSRGGSSIVETGRVSGRRQPAKVKPSGRRENEQ